MSAKDLRIGPLAPLIVFAGAATSAVALLLWLRHGGAVFRELVLTGLPFCM